jgi:hypothetical protein
MSTTPVAETTTRRTMTMFITLRWNKSAVKSKPGTKPFLKPELSVKKKKRNENGEQEFYEERSY